MRIEPFDVFRGGQMNGLTAKIMTDSELIEKIYDEFTREWSYPEDPSDLFEKIMTKNNYNLDEDAFEELKRKVTRFVNHQ